MTNVYIDSGLKNEITAHVNAFNLTDQV